jgi:signal transduction histidine kinase
VNVFKSLRGQLAAVILTVLALGLGLLLIIAGDQMSRMTMEAFTHEQQVLALVLANSFPESFETRQAQQVMAGWVRHRDQWQNDFPADTNVSLYDTRGRLIASSTPTNSGGLAVDQGPALSGNIVSKVVQGRLYTVVPVVHEGQIILGAVQIDSSLASVNARLFSRWLVLIGATGAALLFAFVIALWLAAQLTRPISELRGVAEQMSEGRLAARVELDDAVNELASLGSMFNHMAEQIEGMVQEQRDFVANASHELRSPLSAIKLRAEALADQSVVGDRARQYATEIDDEVGQLAELVNNLLQLSRAESGAFVAPEQPINIVDELAGCVRAVQARVALKHQRFASALPDDIPDLYIHSNDLRLMVGNLLDNAIKYTPDGGQISLTATWCANMLKITIQDTGEGIPPEDIPRISERFFRVDRAHTRNVPGVGLGLALVSAVARQYDGVLRILSTGIPGQGTQACLALSAPSISAGRESRHE